jgi:CheY-like chemotaxis protein
MHNLGQTKNAKRDGADDTEIIGRYPMRSPTDTKRYALVVEDDIDVRELAVVIFEECGLKVLQAVTAEGGFTRMRENGDSVDFILVDINLPGMMTGIDLAKNVRQIWPDTKIVVTSGLPPLAPLPNGVSYLPKPWRILDLLIEAEKVVGTAPSAGFMSFPRALR